MPDASHLLVFIAAGLLLNLTPGPDVMFIVANAVRAGALQRATRWLDGLAGTLFIGFGIRLALTDAPTAR